MSKHFWEPGELKANTSCLCSRYDDLCEELEKLLSHLGEVNSRLNNCSSSSGVAHLHTVQRHRDILQVSLALVAITQLVSILLWFYISYEYDFMQ